MKVTVAFDSAQDQFYVFLNEDRRDVHYYVEEIPNLSIIRGIGPNREIRGIMIEGPRQMEDFDITLDLDENTYKVDEIDYDDGVTAIDDALAFLRTMGYTCTKVENEA